MNAEQREQRPYRSDCGVWMESSGDSQSVARAIAVDVMRELGLDHINDFRTRDRIICAIGSRVDRTLDAAITLGKSLTPEQVQHARWILRRRNEIPEMLDSIDLDAQAFQLLRELVGDE